MGQLYVFFKYIYIYPPPRLAAWAHNCSAVPPCPPYRTLTSYLINPSPPSLPFSLPLLPPSLPTFISPPLHPSSRALDRNPCFLAAVSRRRAGLQVSVPPGTVVRDKDNGGVILGELREKGERLVVAKGGHGGRGNAATKVEKHRRIYLGNPSRV